MSSLWQELGETPLTSLMTGRFCRKGLHKTMDGLVISDLVRMTEESFVNALAPKDQHIGRAFWCIHLNGIREAYLEFSRLADMRVQVEMAFKKVDRLISVARSSGVPY